MANKKCRIQISNYFNPIPDDKKFYFPHQNAIKKIKKLSIDIKCDEIDIMNTINDDTFNLHNNPLNNVAQSAGAVEYTDCTSAEGYDPPPQQVSWI